MKLNFGQGVEHLLEGAIDIHIHSAPDVYDRIMNDMQLARHAKEMGMRAILIKNHFAMTADRAKRKLSAILSADAQHTAEQESVSSGRRCTSSLLEPTHWIKARRFTAAPSEGRVIFDAAAS